jgi:DNA ligase-1
MLIKTLQVLKDIQNCQGTKKKTSILVLNNTPEIKTILRIALDQFVITHLNKISIVDILLDPIHRLDTTEPTFEEFFSVVTELTSSNAANNQIRQKASQLCSRIVDESLREILVKVLTKKLNIGISVKTINKVFPRLIFDKSVMLAQSDSDIILDWKPEDIVANIKYDGVRMIAQYCAENFSFYTRSFNKIPNKYLPNIESQLKRLIDTSPIKDFSHQKQSFFFDGELTAKTRLKISGELNKMLFETFIGDDSRFVFNVFDLVFDDIIDDYETCRDVRPLGVRLNLLEEMYQSLDKNTCQNILKVENLRIKSHEDIRKIFDDYVKSGKEGIIVKNLNSLYVYERSENWIKFKEIKTADLAIVDMKIGDPGSKFANTCGALICESADHKLQVNVGSGLSEEQRNYFWNNKDKMIGQIVEVEYNTIISNERNKMLSLFLPRLKQLRTDKSQANTVEEL